VRHVACDVCGADAPQLFAERPPRSDVLHARFVRCGACGFVYADPRAEPSEARRHYEAVESRGSGALDVDVASPAWQAAVADRRRHLERVGALPTPQPRFLDIGFGDASALAAAAQLGWEPHGLEYAEWLVEAARTRLALEHVHVADVSDAPYADGTFDVVYAWHVIEHVLDIDAWLAQIRRLLRAGGVLVLGTENAGGLFGRVWRLAFRALGRTPWPPTSTDHTYWFGRDSLESVLTRNGFSSSRLRAYENTPAALLRSQRLKAMANPRWAATFLLYLATAAAARVDGRLGGKLEAIAVRDPD
jgi:2-polyprenyl-3-methyl-5-hydroxy-6-metoxy-1,4-benzoquinol methylase